MKKNYHQNELHIHTDLKFVSGTIIVHTVVDAWIYREQKKMIIFSKTMTVSQNYNLAKLQSEAGQLNIHSLWSTLLINVMVLNLIIPTVVLMSY